MLRYLSVCSGIEAATVAWEPLGFQATAFSEIEPFPCAVLAHHYPSIPNLGDMTKIEGEYYRGAVDIVVGGTPCQDFSVAGKRAGLAGPRSGLAMRFVELVHVITPRWIVWENVPGCLSTANGRDFGMFTTALAESGYHLAYRIMDAQYFGVPQRRRRVFIVGYFGDWRPAASVLFEPKSLRGNSSQSKKKRQENPRISGTLSANCGRLTRPAGNCNELDFCVPQIVSQAMSAKWSKGTSGPSGDECHNLLPVCANKCGVRRFTPLECERLQGFPDEYTKIPDASDSARYKAPGNSMAVPVMKWIGERIKRYDK